jgi:hypothetical protein
VVVVVVEVSGAFCSSFAHPAVIMPMATTALNPATAARRRGKRLCVLIHLSLSVYLHRQSAGITDHGDTYSEAAPVP